MRHSVPQDFFTIGYAVLDAAPLHDATWAGFFQLARANPGQVDVPDDPTTVIGAALVSLGHDWNSDSDGDLDDAAALLQELKSAVVIAPAPRRVGRRGALAAMAPSLDYVGARPPVTYVVPGDGTVARVRSWCIPILAPHPVSAHAWLANVIDPTTAAATVLATRRPSPVQSVPDRLPASMLLDPALYPPDDLSGELVFQHLSEAGVQRRHQIWAALRG
jgi:spermidine/putrescine-binding protein